MPATVSWPGATFIALLAPLLVFWGAVVIAASVESGPAFVVSATVWLLLGAALCVPRIHAARTWGAGLVAGATACLPWTIAVQWWG